MGTANKKCSLVQANKRSSGHVQLQAVRITAGKRISECPVRRSLFGTLDQRVFMNLGVDAKVFGFGKKQCDNFRAMQNHAWYVMYKQLVLAIA